MGARLSDLAKPFKCRFEASIYLGKTSQKKHLFFLGLPVLRGGPTAQIDFWQKLKSFPIFCHQGTEVEVVYKWCEAHNTNESWPVTKWKTIRQREAGATEWWAVARTFFLRVTDRFLWKANFYNSTSFLHQERCTNGTSSSLWTIWTRHHWAA